VAIHEGNVSFLQGRKVRIRDVDGWADTAVHPYADIHSSSVSHILVSLSIGWHRSSKSPCRGGLPRPPVVTIYDRVIEVRKDGRAQRPSPTQNLKSRPEYSNNQRDQVSL
jgi:hypothetical protein